MTIAPCDYDTPDSLIYLSGSITPGLRDHAHRSDLGVLVQPGTRKYVSETGTFGHWAVDNGCFAKGDKFDAEAWFAWVETLPTNNLFVVAPDVVGDAVATWQRSEPWLDRIRQLGHPAALVAQDGIEDTEIQWDRFDTLFIGGSTEWKLSDTVVALIAEAHAHGKWVHVGRVNSARRFRHFAAAGADSADGTFLAFGPVKNLPRLLSWLAPEVAA
jgi:hypothetical protein